MIYRGLVFAPPDARECSKCVVVACSCTRFWTPAYQSKRCAASALLVSMTLVQYRRDPLRCATRSHRNIEEGCASPEDNIERSWTTPMEQHGGIYDVIANHEIGFQSRVILRFESDLCVGLVSLQGRATIVPSAHMIHYNIVCGTAWMPQPLRVGFGEFEVVESVLFSLCVQSSVAGDWTFVLGRFVSFVESAGFWWYTSERLLSASEWRIVEINTLRRVNRLHDLAVEQSLEAIDWIDWTCKLGTVPWVTHYETSRLSYLDADSKTEFLQGAISSLYFFCATSCVFYVLFLRAIMCAAMVCPARYSSLLNCQILLAHKRPCFLPKCIVDRQVATT